MFEDILIDLKLFLYQNVHNCTTVSIFFYCLTTSALELHPCNPSAQATVAEISWGVLLWWHNWKPALSQGGHKAPKDSRITLAEHLCKQLGSQDTFLLHPTALTLSCSSLLTELLSKAILEGYKRPSFSKGTCMKRCEKIPLAF